MALQVDVKVGEVLRFAGDGKVSICLKHKSGKLSRLEIEADDSIDIDLPQRQKSVFSVVRDGLQKKPPAPSG